MNNFDACILDLDGTLVNSLKDLAITTNFVLRELGYPQHEVSEYQYFLGRGVTKLLEQALPDEGLSAQTMTKARSLFDEYYNVHCLDHTIPYNGILPLIDELLDRGKKLAVLSNKPQLFVENIINCLFPGKFMAIFGQREGIPRKPDPAGVFEVCSQLNTPAEKLLYVGDSGIDMQTAVAASALPVGVLWGYGSKSELESNGAKLIINKPTELFRKLNNFGA